YFSGIGGVGIGPLAEIARDAGHAVLGSDANEGLVTQALRKRGVALTIGQDGSFLRESHNEPPIDWFVYTAALPADHPELLLARDSGIKTGQRQEVLAARRKERNPQVTAIPGPHGNTTSTGTAVWALQQLKVPVSYPVGSALTFGPVGFQDPSSE